MRSIFDKDAAEGLIYRINKLDAQNQPQWGKMNAYQMLKHCTMSDEMFQGKTKYKRLFAGRLFGGMTLKKLMKSDAPMPKNQPTHPQLKIKGDGNTEAEKQKWISLLKSYERYAESNFMHPFFGNMTKQEVGIFVYKHADHHLRQFGG